MTRCVCPVLDTTYYRIPGRLWWQRGKRRPALIIFPLTTCPLHREWGVADEVPRWWP